MEFAVGFLKGSHPDQGIWSLSATELGGRLIPIAAYICVQFNQLEEGIPFINRKRPQPVGMRNGHEPKVDAGFRYWAIELADH